ncbi:hypothetical protein Tco_0939000 [Tanacetum coccineum]|uniref:Transposase n=1 Tax=Tanacetum coccineum TaxID=301880 RepID=A0ABQ5DIT9_9ASTR
MSWLIQKILPVIRARWSQRHMGPIYIQKDNTKPRIGVDDSKFLQEVSQDGFDILSPFCGDIKNFADVGSGVLGYCGSHSDLELLRELLPSDQRAL